MAVKVIPLTDKKINSAKIHDKDYVLSDGDGLQLRVRSNGSKIWNFNYKHPQTKKRININIGKYPGVALLNARKKALSYRDLLAQDIDPKENREKKLAEDKKITEHTVKNVALEWYELKKHSVTADYATDIWRSLDRHIFPLLENTPISSVTAPMVIDLLRPIEAKGSLETVKRLTQRLNEIMTYAVNGGLIFANPLSGIKANFKKPKKSHMLALTPDELPELMMTIANASIKRTTRCLIEWQLHTMTRPSESAGAKWEEIDIEAKTWTIPPERMKKRREHVVPLTDQALTLLETMRPISGHREYLFPSDRNPRTHANSETANTALRRMNFGGRLVSHGLRSIASTTLNEQGFEADLVEAALAHVGDNQVRNAYNRTDYLERRRPMMYWWSEHIEKASQGNLSVTGFKSLKVIGDNF
ncbi:phage integrase family protein [Psychromonas ingrahamii 37]|uniref:Phage integrase family protein n=1 Tax=Psychromonas ingrahamii (strain DSM 17664 / CCUG 51855 / 37) TaxID=357804 RepID=A1SV83_PSYIN|nr:integrase domain-containing protein [Psychromonas ingrahamii]ABM03398.1 phage integrase family protein [Psychromonas ingrahamii 37]